jgi:hypothetical protein
MTNPFTLPAMRAGRSEFLIFLEMNVAAQQFNVFLHVLLLRIRYRWLSLLLRVLRLRVLLSEGQATTCKQYNKRESD